MRTLFALIAVGLDAAATRFKSKIEKTAAAIATAFIGIGLLASPFLLQADDEDDEIPKIKSIYVTNHGSTGFEIEVRLSSSFPYFVAEGYRYYSVRAVFGNYVATPS